MWFAAFSSAVMRNPLKQSISVRVLVLIRVRLLCQMWYATSNVSQNELRLGMERGGKGRVVDPLLCHHKEEICTFSYVIGNRCNI